MQRRHWLVALAASLAAGRSIAVTWPTIRPSVPLQFPRDHGAHPEYRTEWWYITGQLQTAEARDLGVQITFFRSRPGLQEESASRFAPKQLLFAHAAVADPAHGRLRHDQRAARAGFGLAEAGEGTTDVRLDDWSLVLAGDRYRARVSSREFTLDLSFDATQSVLLQGDAGYSRKGPRPEQASRYYSRPHLAVRGDLGLLSRRTAVTGEAWLDHEWSSEYLSPGAVGWDWIGINLTDGGALMAFRIRDAQGRVIWAGGGHRDAGSVWRAFGPDEVNFEPLRWWGSPRTGARYPVAVRVRVPGLVVDLTPWMDDQELDSRASVGAVYWEGAVRASTGSTTIGRGYLELTGYLQRLRM